MYSALYICLSQAGISLNLHLSNFTKSSIQILRFSSWNPSIWFLWLDHYRVAMPYYMTTRSELKLNTIYFKYLWILFNLWRVTYVSSNQAIALVCFMGIIGVVEKIVPRVLTKVLLAAFSITALNKNTFGPNICFCCCVLSATYIFQHSFWSFLLKCINTLC